MSEGQRDATKVPLGRATTTPARVTEAFLARPDGVAVVSPTSALSRRALDTASVRVARRCADAGVTPGAACLAIAPLDTDGVLAYLAAVRSGAAVVGVDPSLPVDYVRELAARTDATVAVVPPVWDEPARAAGLRTVVVDLENDTADPWDAATCAAATASLPAPGPDDLARICFTSGSTGRPKGIALTHAEDLAARDIAESRPGTRPTALLVPFGPAATRARVLDCLADAAVLHVFDVRRHGLDRMVGFLDEHAVETLRIPVGLYRSLTSMLGDRQLRTVTDVFLTGEAIHGSDLQAFRRCFRPEAQLQCAYGASECGALAFLRVTAGDEMQDGPVVYPRAKRGTGFVVERPDGTPAGELEVGEIVALAGRTALGYYRDPALTATRFFTRPDGVRAFRTGDLGRVHPGGGLEVLGRVDDQVTVRGNNVHLGTVEAALRAVAGVEDVVVVPVQSGGTGTRLVAAVVTTAGASLTVGDLRTALARALPPHMVPRQFLDAVALPRLANGKVDRLAVQRLVAGDERADGSIGGSLALGRAYRPPSTPTEQHIAAVFASVLGLDAVGVDDDFFDLGGDSLAAEELVARLADETRGRVTRGAVLECPTPAALALRADDAPGGTSRADGLVLLHPGGDGTPLFVAPGGGLEPFDLVRLAHRLGVDRPVYSYRSLLYERRGLPHRSVEALAAHCVDAFTRRVGHPPRLVAGYSSGAAVAFEMARRVTAAGAPVDLFASIDGNAPREHAGPLAWRWRPLPPARTVWAGTGERSGRARAVAMARTIATLATRRPRAWLTDRTLGLVRRDHALQATLLFQASSTALGRYRPRGTVAAPAVLLVAEAGTGERRDQRRWAPWLTGPARQVDVPGDHHTLLREPDVAAVADALLPALRDAEPTRG